MKVDFQQNDMPPISDCCLTSSTSSFTTTTTTTTIPTALPPPPLALSTRLSTADKPPMHHDDDDADNTIAMVPFERHRQDEVATLFIKGLLSYDFTGNEAWKVVNEWFVADRLNMEMKDIYTGFNMSSMMMTDDASRQQQQQQQQAGAAAENDTTTTSSAPSAASSFEGLHFMTAIDSSTDRVVGCVGIKRPDQHTLAVLQQNVAELRNDEATTTTTTTTTTTAAAAASTTTTTTCCELVRLSVDQSCRRRGIGKRLVHAVEQFAQRHGYCRICLTTLLVQTQAVALYQSCGYAIIHQEALDDFILPPNRLPQSKTKNIMSLVYLYKQLDV